MAPAPFVFPIVDSKTIFKDEIFKGKVLFCTGGGSGICKGMTEAVVRSGNLLSFRANWADRGSRCVMVPTPSLLAGSE